MGLIKGDLLSLKGIVGLIAVALSLIGAITHWAAFRGAVSTSPYASALLFILTAANFVAYLLGLPFVFCLTAAMFWIVGPTMMTEADVHRRNIQSGFNNRNTIAFAGLVILLTGTPLSFGCALADKPTIAFGVGMIGLIVVAVFDVIGGIILATENLVPQSAAVFIILFIFVAAVLFGSISLHYVSAILGVLMIATYLPPVLGSSDGTQIAGHVISWLGAIAVVTVVLVVLQLTRSFDDDLAGERETKNTKKGESHA